MNEDDEKSANLKLGIQLGTKGLIYFKQSQYNKAVEMYEEALDIARKIGDRVGEGARLGDLGVVYIKLRKYDEAAEKFEAALNIARETGYREGEGTMLGNLGYIYINLGQYDKTAKVYEAALEIAREIGDKDRECTMLGNLGDVYRNLGQYEKAAKINEALKITQEMRDRKGESKMLQADKKFEAALEISRKIGDRKGEGMLLGSLGYIYINLGKYDKAAEVYEAALEIAPEIGDRNRECAMLGNLGDVYRNLGHYDKAVENLEAGLQIAQEIGDRKGESKTQGNLGIVYIYLGQYSKAIEKLEAALVILREIGDRNGESTGLVSLGVVFKNLSHYDKAAEKYKAALEISREIGDRKGEGVVLGSLGTVYDNLGQYDQAAKMYEMALVIAREIGDRKGEVSWLANLGIVYDNLGQYEKAAEMYQASLVIAREIGDRHGEGKTLGNLGIVNINLGEYDVAAEKFEAALEIARAIGDKNGEGMWYGSLGSVYTKLGQFHKAEKMLEAGLEIAREIGDRKGENLWLGNLGICHYAKSLINHQYCKKAIDYLEESICGFDAVWMDIKEDNQKVTFDDVFGSSSIVSKYLHSLYWNTGHFEEALVTREQASSKSLELLLLENRKNNLAVDDALGQENQSHVTLPPVTNFEKMRNVAIQNKSAIIVYDLHVDGCILIWVIKSRTNADGTSLVHGQVPVKKEYISLQYLVESTRRSLGASDRNRSHKRRNKDRESLSLTMPIIGEDKHIADFNDLDLQAVEDELRKAKHGSIYGPTITMKNALRELYDMLILPIEGALVDEQRLTIIPFGDLFALPFAALQDRDGTHLIEKHVLSFAPSIGTLVELEHDHAIPKDKKGSTVIVGTGANLSGARIEAEKVHKIVTTSGQERQEVKKFIGKEATKEAVVDAMQSADIIHLATHGSKDGISLSGLTGDDVKLTMGEVQSLNLKGTKMVVLSACDTFKGDFRTDGVVGITRSFLAAGSSTVIASLWPVNDYSTKEMMVRLYEFLFQNESSGVNNCHDSKCGGDNTRTVDVSYALQQVMIGMLKEEGGSFDIKQWAPFLVYGLNASVGASN